jgi:hypothetical protein
MDAEIIDLQSIIDGFVDRLVAESGDAIVPTESEPDEIDSEFSDYITDPSSNFPVLSNPQISDQSENIDENPALATNSEINDPEFVLTPAITQDEIDQILGIDISDLSDGTSVINGSNLSNTTTATINPDPSETSLDSEDTNEVSNIPTDGSDGTISTTDSVADQPAEVVVEEPADDMIVKPAPSLI